MRRIVSGTQNYTNRALEIPENIGSRKTTKSCRQILIEHLIKYTQSSTFLIWPYDIHQQFISPSISFFSKMYIFIKASTGPSQLSKSSPYINDNLGVTVKTTIEKVIWQNCAWQAYHLEKFYQCNITTWDAHRVDHTKKSSSVCFHDSKKLKNGPKGFWRALLLIFSPANRWITHSMFFVLKEIFNVNICFSVLWQKLPLWNCFHIDLQSCIVITGSVCVKWKTPLHKLCRATYSVSSEHYLVSCMDIYSHLEISLFRWNASFSVSC